jgi:DNA-binding transcriptional MerR regulator
MLGDLRIGELASLAGVSRDTIRYYERCKLLPRACRTQGGYRIYTEQDIEHLHFIKQAQAIGLSLDEIRNLLPTSDAGLAECRQVRDLLSSKLRELDARIGEMRTFRRKLASYLAECEGALARKDQDRCPVLFEISHPSGESQSAIPNRRKKQRSSNVKKGGNINER